MEPLKDIGHSLASVLLVFLLVPAAQAQNNINGKPDTIRGQLRDRANTQDYNHIVEHMEGMVQPEEKYSDEEMQFHYFKAHDYDDNNKLDGIELIAALTHYHKDTAPEEQGEQYDNEELANMLNSMLNFDSNDDGYLDYVEYVQVQKYVSGGEESDGEEERMTDQELQDMVDEILQDEDGNDDGYIDYVEFLRSQGREIQHGSPDMDPKPDIVPQDTDIL